MMKRFLFGCFILGTTQTPLLFVNKTVVIDLPLAGVHVTFNLSIMVWGAVKVRGEKQTSERKA